MSAFVYILFSTKTGKTYTGSTNDILKRINEHNSGKTKSTIRGIPWKIWHMIEYATMEKAREMEKYFKTGAGRRKLKSILTELPKP